MSDRMIISTSFCSSKLNECYVFVKEKYVVVNYAPGKEKKYIIKGPIQIVEGFPMLAQTIFENGIDCAFDVEDNQAFIFSGNQCAKIDYAPHSTNPRLLLGPISISCMFPCLKGTMFENGIDCAIRFVNNSVILFKEDRCARINYRSKSLIFNSFILARFPCFDGTVFESGIDAAFTSHIENECYFFKGKYYVHIKHDMGVFHKAYIVGGRIQRIRNEWPALSSILKR